MDDPLAAPSWEADVTKYRAMILRLGGMMITARRHNTDEWMEHLAWLLNQVCEEIGDDSRFIYDRGQGCISPVI